MNENKTIYCFENLKTGISIYSTSDYSFDESTYSISIYKRNTLIKTICKFHKNWAYEVETILKYAEDIRKEKIKDCKKRIKKIKKELATKEKEIKTLTAEDFKVEINKIL